ncbi:MAG: methyltransferase domain-containing protein [Methylacidiphilales bacterium]|nr:methyltransferase domain-containing protein [Candidatus Methylacidiphilales bacterium]
MQSIVSINFASDQWTKSIPRDCFIDRDDAIIDYCSDRTVLHIGAADAPFDLEKGKRGELLHQKIKRVASSVLGVDVDEGAVKRLESLGIEDICICDITQKESEYLYGKNFEIILCCDVIEHVNNPGALIGACRRYMAKESILIVTTANATGIKPAIRALQGREAVHCDHVCYYSYSTLCQLLIKCNFRPDAFGVFSYPTLNPLVGRISRAIMRRFPGASDGIFLTAKLI